MKNHVALSAPCRSKVTYYAYQRKTAQTEAAQSGTNTIKNFMWNYKLKTSGFQYIGEE